VAVPMKGLSVSVRSEHRNEQERTQGHKERNRGTGLRGNELGTKRKGGEGRGAIPITYSDSSWGHPIPHYVI
jgi:hypothetical protein